MLTRGVTRDDIDAASPDAWNLLLDRHKHGAIGFAAEASWKARILQAIQENTMVTGSAFGGTSGGKVPSAFEMLPEERRYFDPDYLDMERFDDILEAARGDSESGLDLHKQLMSNFGDRDADCND